MSMFSPTRIPPPIPKQRATQSPAAWCPPWREGVMVLQSPTKSNVLINLQNKDTDSMCEQWKAHQLLVTTLTSIQTTGFIHYMLRDIFCEGCFFVFFTSLLSDTIFSVFVQHPCQLLVLAPLLVMSTHPSLP